MIGTHFDDDAILSAVAGGEAVPRRGVMEHALKCGDCASRLQEVTELVDGLAAPGAWESAEPVLDAPPPPLLLAGFVREASRLEEEDDEARSLVVDVEAGFSGTAAQLRAQLPATAGAVRQLLEAADRSNDDAPGRSLIFSDAALALAEGLQEGAYPGTTVFMLRGLAWKEKGKALRMLGRFPDAVEALEQAASFVSLCAAGGFELAGVELAKAMIFRETGRLGEAAELARQSAETYLQFGDLRRHRNARMIEAAVLYSANDFAGARDLFLSLVTSAQQEGDFLTLAHLYTNIAHCCRDLGDFEAAATWFHQALAVTRETGSRDLVARPLWGLARMLISAGKLEEGLARLRETEADFASRGVALDAAFAALEAAEVLLLLGRYDEVTSSCRRLISLFQAADVTSSAITALSFLREAAEKRSLTSDGIVLVREHLRRLPDEPNLLFLPPAE